MKNNKVLVGNGVGNRVVLVVLFLCVFSSLILPTAASAAASTADEISAVDDAAIANDIIITATPERGVAPITIKLSAQSKSGLSIKSYAWDFTNDGEIDSTDAEPSATYASGGSYTIRLEATTEANGTPQVAEGTKDISIQDAITISLIANPSSGTAPLTVQFTAAAAGEEPLSYAWDYTSDGTFDSTLQNPTTTYEAAGIHRATVRIMDAAGTVAEKGVTITVASFESKLNVTSYFPTTLAKGEQQVTFIISNEGEQPLRDITAKVIGKGLQHFSSSSIGSLKPGEQDSLTVKMNVLETGTLAGILKVADKSFPVEFTITKEISYNLEELQAQYSLLKGKLDEQEQLYAKKKSEGFLVAEVFESIKMTKKQLQDAQQQLLTNNPAAAQVNLGLAASSIEDIARDLTAVKKQKVTPLQWIKENAVAVAAIIASLGAISGFLVKLRSGAKKVTEQVGVHAKKVGENVKGHFKKSEKEEQKSDEESKEEQPAIPEDTNNLKAEEKKES